MSLRTKILLLVIFSGVSTALLLTATSFLRLQKQAQKTSLNILQKETTTLQDLLTHSFYEKAASLRLLSQESCFKSDCAKDQIQSRLIEFQDNEKQFDSVGIYQVQKDGLSATSLTDTDDESPLFSKGTLKKAIQNKSLVTFERNKNLQDVDFVVFHTVTKNQKAKYILAGRTKVSSFSEYLQRLSLAGDIKSSLSFEIISSDGLIVFSSVTPGDMFKEAVSGWTTISKSIELMKNTNTPSLLLQDRDSYTVVSSPKNYLGFSVPLHLVVKIPKTTFSMEAVRNLGPGLLATLLFAFLFLVPIGFITNNTLKPMQDLADVAEKVGLGQFEEIQNLKTTNDEIGTVVKSFKKMNSNLKASMAELVETSKTKIVNEMAGGMAHEFSQPLTIIQGSTEIIKSKLKMQEIEKPEIVRLVEKIESNTKRIAKILRALRIYGRSHRAQPAVFVSLRTIIEEALLLCQERLHNHHVDLRLELPEPDIEIKCDQVQMIQLLFNLVVNSLDAIQKTASPWIEIKTHVKTSSVVIAIKDSGSGISPEVAHKMMDPFFTTKEIGYGAGLGLSVALGIVKSHNGTITLDRESANTQFLVEIPTESPIEAKKAS